MTTATSTFQSFYTGISELDSKVNDFADYCRRRSYSLYATTTTYDGFFQVYLAVDEHDGEGLLYDGHLFEETALYDGEWMISKLQGKDTVFATPADFAKEYTGSDRVTQLA